MDKNEYAIELYRHTFDRDRDGSSTSQFIRVFVTRIEGDRPISNSYTWADRFAFRAFACWSQGGGDFRCESWEPIYDQVFSVDYRESEVMHKTLAKLRKVQDKLPVRPETFGQFVVLMAKAMGIKRMIVYDSRDEFRLLKIDRAQDFIRTGLDGLRDIVAPAKSVA